jgi:GH25 family lysozyme M1 (1,4-beta-N-acetylmuramidase)
MMVAVVALVTGLGGVGAAGAQVAPGGAAATAAATPDAVSTVTGPDVSSWQHPGGAAINWGQVAASGQSFAFVKATEGKATASSSFYTNPWFASDFAGALAAGLYRGAYDFARPALPLSSAQAEAANYVSVAGSLSGTRDLPPVLDLEVTGGLSPADLTNWAATWLGTVRSLTGRVPMVYASPNFWSTSLGGSSALSGYRLWEADWTTASSVPAMGGWGAGGWTFWQFTDAASVPGISGGVDLSRFNGSLARLAAATGVESVSTGPSVYLRNTATSGVADSAFRVGAPGGGTTLMCDWNGDGVATPGVFLNGTWFVTNSNTGGPSQLVFGYGNAGDVPVCGDWDGNGTQTPGVFRAGHWYLTNTVGSGAADISLGYGNPGDTPVVGDWNGNGTDTPGVFRNGTWYLTNSLTSGAADAVVGYGNPGDVPVVGDWDGNGSDTPGVFRNGTWYLTNSLAGGVADLTFSYGDAGDTPRAGRWVSGQPTAVAVVR